MASSEVGDDEPRDRSAVGTFGRFAGLPLINPTTALYFAALTTAQGDALRGGAAGAVFVGGAFVASLARQQLLVAMTGLPVRISARARAWTFRIGYGLGRGVRRAARPAPAVDPCHGALP
ncbi:hypothetical protein [Streptomyces sp. H27-C3]|uniref:hypothetical protein n=1 Tax=Streptomyces sp. H27-C3 TaxID=3046305 RepID=UPI0024BA77FA|nr:hypothetical protein [Streptomyces sp. H27-C3]MDJ0462956.1 hypothetical protein [Streptomyces sp. H27-C3]